MFRLPLVANLRVATLFTAICVALGTPAPCARAIDVKLSLNVFPTSFAAPNSGGVWSLVAKTNHALGISGVNAYLLRIDTTGISYGPNINADLLNGEPFVFPGNPTSVAYLQAIFGSTVVFGVGTPGFSSTADPLGNPNWNNATLLFTGTYSGAVPAFGTQGGEGSSANLFVINTPPYLPAIEATISTTVRVALSGDYKRDGVVDAADYTVWRDQLGATVSATSSPDGNGNAIVDEADYQIWRTNFGQHPAGAAALATTATQPIPEPAALQLATLQLAAAALACRRRR